MSNFRIALTPGEPAGIGPDLIIQLAQSELPAELVVLADPQLLKERAQVLGLPLTVIAYDPNHIQAKKHQLTVLPISLAKLTQCGVLATENASYVISTLQRATQGCLAGEFGALVTGPVHKGVINQAGISFTGHTEFLASLTHTDQVVMLLQTEKMRVALMTTHLPLRAVPDAITTDLITNTLQILQADLQRRFKIAAPRILVCGLNPHAGENGYLGREEIEVIIPALEKLRASGVDLIGPVPADTAFIPQNLARADAVVAMYHDQGLAVLKYSGFDSGVNITLGLPFIRTSVDHGTALELAGTGKANPASLLAAIKTAMELKSI